MSGESDRDQSIERLLRRTMRRATPTATTACLDAETLAAWAERTLAPHEAATVEHHLSDCARCQAMLAVFARTEPQKPAGADRRRWLWWLIPIAAGSIAAAAVAWIVWPTSVRPPANLSARVELPAPEPPVSSAVPQQQGSTGVAAGPRTTVPPAPPRKQTADAGRSSPAQSSTIDSVSEVRPNAESAPAQPAPVPARPAASPPPQAAPVAAPGLERSRAESLQSSPQANAAEMRVGVAGAQADQAAAKRLVPSILSEFVGTDQRPVGRPVAAAGGGQGRGGASPARGPVRWRIFASGNVERSTSGGASWEPVAIDAPAFVTAGDAPSPLVCWLVGRDGLILRSVDGVHFERLSLPDSASLVSVRALDASRATVTTTDGRAYATVDGGQSWQSPTYGGAGL